MNEFTEKFPFFIYKLTIWQFRIRIVLKQVRSCLLESAKMPHSSQPKYLIRGYDVRVPSTSAASTAYTFSVHLFNFYLTFIFYLTSIYCDLRYRIRYDRTVPSTRTVLGADDTWTVLGAVLLPSSARSISALLNSTQVSQLKHLSSSQLNSSISTQVPSKIFQHGVVNWDLAAGACTRNR